MKQYILSIALVLITGLSIAGTGTNENGSTVPGTIMPEAKITSGGEGNHASTITPFDTVFFDLSHIIYSAGHVEFPISILTDDTIFALDFSFKFNHADVVFDTIINLTSYLQIFAYYNTADSTVRLTSNSLQGYGNDTPLVSVHFDLLSSILHDTDLYALSGFLNGDACTVSIRSYGPNAVNENDKPVYDIFPVPASENLNIRVNNNADVYLIDIEGRELLYTSARANETAVFNTRELANGIYFVRIVSSNEVSTRKVVVRN